MRIASILLSSLASVEAIHYPFGVYGGSVAKTVHMEALIRSADRADVDILVKLPKAKRLSVEGWVLFRLEMAEIRVEEGRMGTSRVTFLPNGVESHPTAIEMKGILSNIVNIDFPMTGVYKVAQKTITYEFGPFDLVLEGFGSGKLLDVVPAGTTITTFKTPDDFKGSLR